MSTHWDKAAVAFRADLARAVPTESLRALHTIRPLRHLLVVLRQTILLAACVFVILRWGQHEYVWIPASVVLGFIVFGFTVLLHEVVHEVVVPDRKSRWHGLLGQVYAALGGLSFAQFRRWHLDHHDNLGTEDADPKRHSLTPRIVTRTFKALYFTPALFPIYFRAARREAENYPPRLQRRIARERGVATALHVGTLLALGFTLGWPTALKLHVLPVFVVFPVAFTINRLGQHYDIVPGDPARWGTRLKPSPLLWDRVFLWSNYHLEHHYFPRVPFYRLPRLSRLLAGFLDERGSRPRTYGGLLWDWLVRNETPHTDWRRLGHRGPGESPRLAPTDG